MRQNRTTAIGFVILLALTACGGSSRVDKFRNHCKAAAEHLVATPSTIDFVRNKFRFSPNQTVVILEFDAQNTYGAQIRHTLKCVYIEPFKDMVEASEIVLDYRALSELRLLTVNISVYMKHELRME